MAGRPRPCFAWRARSWRRAGAITTTTTRIFAAQIALAPAHVPAADATRERVSAALATHRHVLVIGATDPDTGKADGVSMDLFRRLHTWCPGVCILNEADGSHMRPFKAPAEHEPVIPEETTLVVPVVGADVFGKTLGADHVHRPELVSALSGAALGTPITPEIVARVLAHLEGGRKGVKSGTALATGMRVSLPRAGSDRTRCTSPRARAVRVTSTPIPRDRTGWRSAHRRGRHAPDRAWPVQPSPSRCAVGASLGRQAVRGSACNSTSSGSCA